MDNETDGGYDLVPVERLNDQQCAGSTHKRRPGSTRCYCGVFTYSTRKYLPHQNGREQLRRLRQLRRGQLTGNVNTLEAREMIRHIERILALNEAEQVCLEHHSASLAMAVVELGRFLRGEPEHDTVTTSALIGLPEPVAPLDRNGDDDLALLQD